MILDGNHDYLRLGARVDHGDQGRRDVARGRRGVVCRQGRTRDGMMAEEAEHFPAYGFESNRGYPAPVHKCALGAYGPTTIHRRSWVFMDELVWGGLAPAPGRLF